MAKKTPAKKPSKVASKPLKKAASKAPAQAKKVVAPIKKASPAKKVAPVKKGAPAKKIAPVKKALQVKKEAPVKKAPSKSLPAKTSSKSSSSKAKPGQISESSSHRVLAQQFVKKPAPSKVTLTPFLIKQRQRLLELKDTLLDSMRGVARDNLHAGSETSAFGMHQADAGSDAYDRDFALSMLSKEQGSLYEIDEALKRIEYGTYGVCDLCEKPIRHDRLEALPFTRYTVECQAELEKRQHHHSVRPHINSLFGLTEEELESEEEESSENS